MLRSAFALLFASAMSLTAQTTAAPVAQNNAATAAAAAPTVSAAAPTEVAIQVDLAKPLGTYKPIGRWFGYDESDYTFMQYGKQLLGELHDMSPVPVYIRAHHLLPPGMEFQA